MKNQKFRRLDIWKKSMVFITKIYKSTEAFPSKEIYALSSQLRRAVNSIALNIAEGSASGSDKEFNRFLTISLRSNYEVMCAIEIALTLKYYSEAEANDLLKDCDELAAMIGAFRKKLKAES